MTFQEPFVLDGSPEGRAMAAQFMSMVDQAMALHDRLLSMSSWTANASSNLSGLADQLQDAPVSLERSLCAAAIIVRTSLEMLKRALREPGTYAVSVAILARAALIPSGRIVYALGPEDEGEQLDNSRLILIQDGSSYIRALGGATGYQHLARLHADENLVAEVRTKLREVSLGSRPMGEERMLQRMADVVGHLLAAEQHGGPAQIAAYVEHINAIFQFYSGFAHGYGWPTLRPQAELVADLHVVGSTGLLAMDLLTKRVSV